MMDWAEDHPTADAERPRLWSLIRETPNLDWLLLTKRPENIELHLPSGRWANVWLGATVEDQANVSRIQHLRNHRDRVPVLFVSAEPMIGPIDADLAGMDWVIIGGESGRNARPMALDWASRLVDDCRAADAAVFVKQLGSAWAKTNGSTHPKGGDPEEWPESLRIREYPQP